MSERLIIYDAGDAKLNGRKGDVLLCACPMVKPCRGCFSCWLKTPGKCIIKDRCPDMAPLIAKCDELIIISPVLYGGYSENIKAIVDRSIPYVLPYFRIVSGEMHHKMRYKNNYKLTVCFYGECDDEEKQIAKSLVRANVMNLGAKTYEVKFFDGLEKLRSEVL